MDSETASFVMGTRSLEEAKQLRRRSGVGSRLRPSGAYYGLSAYGYAYGAISGVQNPYNAPQTPAEGGDTPMEAMGPQWGGGGEGGAGGDGGGGGGAL